MLTAGLLIVVWILPGVISGMHESDQATVLADAWHLSKGGSWQPLVFYNYDKLFVTDWLLAAVFWTMRQIGGTDPVVVGNLFASLLLTASALVVQAAARFRWPGYAAFLATLLAPTFLMHAPFMAPAFVSASFLLLLFAVIETSRGRRRWWHHLLMIALTFAAVGSRADAVFALPFLVWLEVPLGCPLWQFWRIRVLPAMAAGAVVAAGISLQFRDADVLYVSELAINIRVFAAYTLFGIGGALPLLGWTGLRMMSMFRRRGGRPRLGWVMGFGLLAPPFVFYAVQLYSTRYWAVGLTTFLLWIASRRGQALLNGKNGQAVVAVALVAAVVPLGVGVVVPTLHTWPRFVTAHATMLPSADGLIPMGAFLGHDFARRNPEAGGARDTNHAVWLAADRTEYLTDADGHVPVLVTADYSFLRLATVLHGQQVKPFKIFEVPPVCYVDTRSLIKFPRPLTAHEQANDPMEDYVAHARIEAVSPPYRGIAIQRVEKGVGSNQARPVWDVFRNIFFGDDFWPREGAGVWEEGGALRAEFGRGTTVAVLSPAPFELAITSRDGSTRNAASAADMSFPMWQVVIIGGDATEVVSARLVPGPAREASYYSAEAVLPDYMSQNRKPR